MRVLLLRLLRENGFTAHSARDGREMWQALAEAPADLLLLDLMLPGSGGLDLCRAVRQTSQVPIIMVTARGDEIDRVLGLELGADDYIAKPFSRPELLARVRAVLRRGRGDGVATLAGHSDTLRFAGWRLDLRRRELVDPQDTVVDLSGAEHDMLLAFLENPQRVLSRDRLLELSRARLGEVLDRSVDVLVSRLRRKLEAPEPARPLIRTVRGVGYIFTAEVVRD